jgi:hypothetical protein
MGHFGNTVSHAQSYLHSYSGHGILPLRLTHKMHSQADIKALIFKTLDYDKARKHTVETLLQQLRVMRVVQSISGVRTYPFPSIVHHVWTENDIRTLIAELIQGGRLDMRSDGTLLLLEVEDSAIEKYQGAWYATVNGSIKGPFKTEGEAVNAVSSLCSVRGKELDSSQAAIRQR